MDKRENKSLGAKQFRTLYTDVTKVTNILYYGAESGLNVLDPNGPASSTRLPVAIRGLSAMDTDDSEVGFYAKNTASIEDYRRLTLRGEGNTIQRGEVKTTQGGGKTQVQKVDAGKKREAPDKTGSWVCDKYTKRNFQCINKDSTRDSTVERTHCFHCRSPKNPNTSSSVKDSKSGTLGMVAKDPQGEELTKQVALITKKQDDTQSLEDKVAQLEQQLQPRNLLTLISEPLG